MDVHLDIPEDLAQQLASDANGLARAALWRQHTLCGAHFARDYTSPLRHGPR